MQQHLVAQPQISKTEKTVFPLSVLPIPSICNLILRFSHTAEYMSVQANIANTQAQRVREAVNKIRPSKKDLQRLGKGNMAGVMTGENILKEIHIREEKNKEKAAKKGSRTRKSAQKAAVITQIPVTPVRPRVQFQMEETPTRLLRSATSAIPYPNYYLPLIAEVIEDDSDAESFPPLSQQTPLKMDTALVPPYHTLGQKRPPPPRSLD
ncbi:hypothetical protein BDD12DRAFT_801461 [Trichophaea hybrida]|nr:hypothetical protein BDD12DRAFT_801461 [Trichophaea hybrida]